MTQTPRFEGWSDMTATLIHGCHLQCLSPLSLCCPARWQRHHRRNKMDSQPQEPYGSGVEERSPVGMQDSIQKKHICWHALTHVCVCVYVCACMCVNVCVYVCVCVCVCVCGVVFVYVCVGACVCLCVCPAMGKTNVLWAGQRLIHSLKKEELIHQRKKN